MQSPYLRGTFRGLAVADDHLSRERPCHSQFIGAPASRRVVVEELRLRCLWSGRGDVNSRSHSYRLDYWLRQLKSHASLAQLGTARHARRSDA